MAPRRRSPPDEFRQRPLEPPENAEVRDRLEDWRFWQRFGSVTTRLAAWTAGIGAMVAVFRETITEAIRWLLRTHQ